MADAARKLICAIDVLAAEIEREIFAGQRTAKGVVTDFKDGQQLALRRCEEAVQAVQSVAAAATPGEAHLPRGEIAAAMRRLENLLARRNRLSTAPRVCGM